MAISLDEANKFIASAVAPLLRTSTDSGVVALVGKLGWELPSVPSGFHTLYDSAFQLLNSLGQLRTAGRANDQATVASKLAELTSFVGVVVGNIEALPNSINAELPASFRSTTNIAGNIRKRLFDYLICSAITVNSPGLKSLLFALGIVDETTLDEDPTIFQPAFVRFDLNLDRVRLLFTDQAELLRQTYGWGSSDIDEDRLFRAIEEASYGLLRPPVVSRPSAAFLNAMFPGVRIPSGGLGDMLAIPLLAGFGVVPLTLGVLPGPSASAGTPQPLAVRLIGAPHLDLSTPISSTLTLSIQSELALDAGIGVLLHPDSPPTMIQSVEGGGAPATHGSATLELRREDAASNIPIFDFGGGSDLRIKAFSAQLSLDIEPSDISAQVGLQGGVLTVSLGSADGFLRSVVPADSFQFQFDLGVGWSNRRGLFITGSAGFETVLVLNLTFGPVELQTVRIRVIAGDDGLKLEAGLGVAVTLGPITGVVQGLGVRSSLDFRSGNLGPANLDVGFLFPTGVGIAVDAGVVKGGGFLSFDNDAGRYSGVIDLQVFSIAVKAFGLLDTKLPDGSPGYSFVIVIIAEFTPIQLGFGFTLLGVGGLVGVNRSIDQQVLSDAVRTGSLENLLFPQNVVQDAPNIINALATAFPAAKGHYIFGPMAKLGWGTPTLITAELGIIIEFPGPRLALLGLLRMLLPDPDTAILRLQMAVLGLLDVPAKKFSLDASLFDSTVAGFVVTADMAYRMQFGDKSSFLLSVGGFNPGFQPPPPFPKLRAASVNFGINGNPSLVASGYFALTSNTAQIGASIQLHASGFGIHLDGWLGFDVLFVFSPFSFTASISAGVRVSFHGVGFGVTLHGSLSGPNPWHLNGKVCVSVLWWDACLPVDVTFGNNQPANLPEIDPWFGDPDVPVIGLAAAISDAHNWAGSALPSEFTVVTLADASTAERTPIDPLGAATLRQKVAPLNRKLEKFGQYRPKEHDQFSLGPGMGTVSIPNPATSVPDPVTEIEVVEDDFVPDHFMNLTNEQKLSLPSYEPMDAGISVAPNRTNLGSNESRVLDYVTKYIDADGTLHDNQPLHRLTQAQLNGLLTRSAAALGGVRNAGTEKYILAGRPQRIQLGPRAFVVADSCTLVRNASITGTEISQTQAVLALNDHLRLNPEDRGGFAVIPVYSERAA